MIGGIHRNAGIVLLLMFTTFGCVGTQPVNPSFPLSVKEADAAMQAMKCNRQPLLRPLVIIGGFLDPNPGTVQADRLRVVFNGGTIIKVSVGFCSSFDECRKRVLDAVDRVCPSANTDWTTEVDVVGISMGGLVARYAAAPCNDASRPRRLRIARLFTISSPHDGATLSWAAVTKLQRDMRPGSPFLNSLAASDVAATYEFYPYVRLGDEIVGEQNAAPRGMTPFWLPNVWPMPSHFGALSDPRILADIARRLRGETPFSHNPPAALPQASDGA